MDSGTKRLHQAIGRRVRELRTAQGLTQERLAALAGVHRTFVGKVERGESATTVDTIGVLCHALDTTLARFFDPFDERLPLTGPRRGGRS